MREADSAFGDPTMFLEQAVLRPRHIEVQILADATGETVHLFERDCSVQRRHQKVIEIAPAPNLDDDIRQALYRDAIAFAKSIGYVNAGTVEFLRRHRGGARRPARVHRDEPAHPGRAHRHRRGHRRRPRAVPDAHRLGQTLAELGLQQERPPPARSRAAVPHHDRGPRRRASAPTPARSPPTVRRAARGIRLDGGTIAPGRPDQPALRLDAREDDLPRPRLRRRRGPRQARAGRVPHPRRLHQHPVPAGRARRPRPSSPATSAPPSSTSAPSWSRRSRRRTAARRSSPGWPTSPSTSRTATAPASSVPRSSCR